MNVGGYGFSNVPDLIMTQSAHVWKPYAVPYNH